MTESTPTEASMPADPEKPETPEPASTGEGGDKAADTPAAQSPFRRRLVLVGVAVAVLLAVAAVAFALMRPGDTQVGECVKETDVVSCAEPHDARIVQIVDNVNDCGPPSTHAFKDADGRYLCVVEEAS